MKQRKPMFSLDVLALALLTCLLASVVSMLVMSEGGNALNRWKLLHEKTLELTNGAIEVQATQQQLARQIAQRAELLRLEREQRIAQSEADELERKIVARRKIADAATETTRLREELAKLEPDPKVSQGRHQIVGNYRGPYILIECLQGYALVYPGKTRLAKNPDQETLQQLVDRITRAGFVVFVVRPAGWFVDSFDSLHQLVYPLLAEFEKKSGRKIGRSTFPLESRDTIAPYLPPDPDATSPTVPEPEQHPPSTVKPRQRSRS